VRHRTVVAGLRVTSWKPIASRFDYGGGVAVAEQANTAASPLLAYEGANLTLRTWRSGFSAAMTDASLGQLGVAACPTSWIGTVCAECRGRPPEHVDRLSAGHTVDVDRGLPGQVLADYNPPLSAIPAGVLDFDMVLRRLRMREPP
jgi:hypothetical protein